MFAEMIFLLKFVDINYPPMVRQMFERKNTSLTLIFYFTFLDDARDSSVVPPLFQYYNVSVYFLNNVGEALCQMIAIIMIAPFFLLIIPYNENKEGLKLNILMKIAIFIRDALVWETTLFYVFMNLQKLIFFIACSCMFPPINTVNALVNFSIAIVAGFLISLWFLHLINKIKVCQNFKTEKENNDLSQTSRTDKANIPNFGHPFYDLISNYKG